MSDMPEPTPMPACIATKLAAASTDAQAVAKGSRNDFAHYDYASAEEIITHCRPLFTLHGLGVARICWSPLRWLCTNDGEASHRVQSWMQLTDLESGSTWLGGIDWPVVTSKGRPLDKAEASALTDSLKYWLLGILMLPRGDIEMDQREDGLSSVLPTKKTTTPGAALSGKPTL
jgi:hypothetical protein